MEKYWQKYKDELDEDDAYENIRRAFRLQDDDYYARGGRGSSSNNQRGDGSSYSSYHNDPESKLRELASALEKCQDFFLSQGLDYKLYLTPIESNRRDRNR